MLWQLHAKLKDIKMQEQSSDMLVMCQKALSLGQSCAGDLLATDQGTGKTPDGNLAQQQLLKSDIERVQLRPWNKERFHALRRNYEQRLQDFQDMLRISPDALGLSSTAQSSGGERLTGLPGAMSEQQPLQGASEDACPTPEDYQNLQHRMRTLWAKLPQAVKLCSPSAVLQALQQTQGISSPTGQPGSVPDLTYSDKDLQKHQPAAEDQEALRPASSLPGVSILGAETAAFGQGTQDAAEEMLDRPGLLDTVLGDTEEAGRTYDKRHMAAEQRWEIAKSAWFCCSNRDPCERHKYHAARG